MHAASLTKGYGGNPPSGRSVSPPRTGPFFVPPRPTPPPPRPAPPCAPLTPATGLGDAAPPPRSPVSTRRRRFPPPWPPAFLHHDRPDRPLPGRWFLGGRLRPRGPPYGQGLR